MNTNQSSQYNNPEEITKLGEEIYFSDLKNKLEKTNNGDYLVLEVQSRRTFISGDLTEALKQANAEFPDKIFYIVQIGSVQRPSSSFKDISYGWLL